MTAIACPDPDYKFPALPGGSMQLNELSDALPQKRPALTLSSSAFASASFFNSGSNSPGFRSPALVPISSPAPRANTPLYSHSATSSSGAASPSPLTPASTAGKLFWASRGSFSAGNDSVRSPVPWGSGVAPPAAPHLSEEKGAFSPLPRTPDGWSGTPSGASVFAKMQEKYLASCEDGEAGSKFSNSPTGSFGGGSGALEFGGWGGRRGSAAGLGFRRASVQTDGGSPGVSGTRRPSLAPDGGLGWSRRPSLLATEPITFASFAAGQEGGALAGQTVSVPQEQARGNGLRLEGMPMTPTFPHNPNTTAINHTTPGSITNVDTEKILDITTKAGRTLTDVKLDVPPSEADDKECNDAA